MTMTMDGVNTGSASKAATKDSDGSGIIWLAIAAFVTILGGSAVLFGLAGLVTVMVPAALAMVIILLRIVTEGM